MPRAALGHPPRDSKTERSEAAGDQVARVRPERRALRSSRRDAAQAGCMAPPASEGHFGLPGVGQSGQQVPAVRLRRRGRVQVDETAP